MTTPNKLAASLFIGYSPMSAVEGNASTNSSFTFLRVKAMEHAMHKRRKQHRYDPDERQAGKQSVTGRKNLGDACGQRIADWTHSAENHRRIQERIDPAQVRKPMITQNTDSKSKHQNSKGHQPVSPHTFAKFSPA
jgi:hypothetical protein